MGKVTKHLEGHSREQRIKVRRELGKLKDLTVQSPTRKRYNRALELFGVYLKDHHLVLPRDIASLDPLVSDYIEHVWATGEGKALASDTVAAIQDNQPQTRNRLPSVWRLMKAWSMHEIPNRAPPLPESALHALVGLAFFRSDYWFGISLLVGFYGMLRTGELLQIKSSHITMSRECGPAVIFLGYTKGGRRMGAAESVTINVIPLCRFLWKWVHSVSRIQNLCPPSHIWRQQFNAYVQDLKFDAFSFRPYSLRRGGLTFWFQQHNSLDKLCIQGRWAAQKTARIYINEGLAMLAELQLPWTPVTRRYLSTYTNACKAPIPKLDHTSKGGRSGGRGSKQKSQVRVSKKALFSEFLGEMQKRQGRSVIFPRLGGEGDSTQGFWPLLLLAWRE